jgi:hypothetical protein
MITRTSRIDGNHRYSWIKEPAIVVRKVRPALHFAPQNNQLMSERGILSLKPGVRLEWRGQDGQDETQ